MSLSTVLKKYTNAALPLLATTGAVASITSSLRGKGAIPSVEECLYTAVAIATLSVLVSKAKNHLPASLSQRAASLAPSLFAMGAVNVVKWAETYFCPSSYSSVCQGMRTHSPYVYAGAGALGYVVGSAVRAKFAPATAPSDTTSEDGKKNV